MKRKTIVFKCTNPILRILVIDENNVQEGELDNINPNESKRLINNIIILF